MLPNYTQLYTIITYYTLKYLIIPKYTLSYKLYSIIRYYTPFTQLYPTMPNYTQLYCFRTFALIFIQKGALFNPGRSLSWPAALFHFMFFEGGRGSALAQICLCTFFGTCSIPLSTFPSASLPPPCSPPGCSTPLRQHLFNQKNALLSPSDYPICLPFLIPSSFSHSPFRLPRVFSLLPI